MQPPTSDIRLWSAVAGLACAAGTLALLAAGGLVLSTTDPTLATGLSVPAALVCASLLAVMGLGLIARWAHMRATLATLRLLAAAPTPETPRKSDAAKSFAPHPIFMARAPR